MLLALCLMLSLLPSAVFAAEGDNALTPDDNGTITLTGDTTASLTVNAGETRTLDLAGHKLTNSGGQHTITNNGTLIIMDSSQDKAGTVDNVSNGKAALYNQGTCTVQGGTFTRSAESTESTPSDGKGNSWYVIRNGNGTQNENVKLTFENGTVTSQGNFSSLVDNYAVLEIKDGTFSNGMIVIKNEETGTLSISGGTYTANYYSETNNAVSALQNWGTATVNDGTFTSKGVAVYASEWDRASTLTITGGTFTGDFSAILVTSDSSNTGGATNDNDVTVDISNATINGDIGITDPDGGEKQALTVNVKSGTTVSGDLWTTQADNSQTKITVDSGATVKPTENAAAKIGSVGYANLSSAIAAAGENDTIIVNNPLSLSQTIAISKDITIDLNGKIITGNDVRAFHVKSGTLTLTGEGTVTSVKAEENGSLVDNSSVIRVGDNGTATTKASAGLVIDPKVTISAPDTYGVSVFGSGTTETVTVKGTIHATGDAAALSGNGNNGFGGTTITIEDGAEVTSENNVAIYHPQAGTLTIKGGIISGTSGIEAKAGETTVSIGGTPIITATGEVTDPSGNTNGTSTSGYAVVMVNNSAYAGGAKATLNSGSYVGKVGVVNDGQSSTPTEDGKKASLTVAGGNYSESVAEYVADNLTAELIKSTGDTPYSYYPSVDAAQAAAGPNDLVRDLSDDAQAKAQILGVGFNATKAGAEEAINGTIEQLGKTTEITDCDENTMWAFLQLTDTAADYKLVVKNASDEVVYKSGTNDALSSVTGLHIVYFTFNQEGGSPSLKEIASGKYTVTLYSVADSAETEVDTSTITLSQVSYALNGGTLAEVPDSTYYTAGTEITLPTAPTKSGYTFTGWYVGNTKAGDAGATYAVPADDVILTAQWPKNSSSSGGGVTTYAVTTNSPANGTVTVSSKSAAKGATVTITVTPAEGYQLDKLTVADKDGKGVALTDKGNGKYTFTMPASKVEVTATFKQAPVVHVCPAEKYTDVDTTQWYHEGVDYVIANGMMNGTGTNIFEPNATTTRGMIVTILYRLEKEPAAGTSPFTDVDAGQWYAKAVAWAAANGVVNGTSPTTFNPNDPITREQMAAILYRYASFKGYDVTAKADLAGFTDAAQISDYAKDPMAWANKAGLIGGVSATTLQPQGSAIRAQVATILMRFCENVVK